MIKIFERPKSISQREDERLDQEMREAMESWNRLYPKEKQEIVIGNGIIWYEMVNGVVALHMKANTEPIEFSISTTKKTNRKRT